MQRTARRNKVGRFLKGAGTAVSIAGKALAVAKGVAALINIERKWFDTVAVSTAASTTPAINCLSAVPQGVTENQRVGESIKAMSFDFRAFIKWEGITAGLSAASRVRLLLLRDLDPNSNATAPTIGQILQNTGTTQYLLMSFLNKDYGHRFQILKDKVYSENNTIGGKEIKYHYKFAPLVKQTNNPSRKCDPHIRWTSTAGTDYEFGHIYAVVIGDRAAGSTIVTIEYVSRLNYVDN